eukprot:CAMPEP_0201483150 /NCGR_PEP_ID=MMETSP0151_2-20130828/7369_1 /ASSEMBLY_ACC=CAM_ASM_000257 /TAXON_ID=200890 /ORGANISM="Paramoeba atlantica, Strain 621/1 / CCAP 1560/9" /LENGTH=260 /DNA_ID=CAMNT_0047866157 /DNA_START=91 /DNA_END=873 /DNA_ORIENTATION=-
MKSLLLLCIFCAVAFATSKDDMKAKLKNVNHEARAHLNSFRNAMMPASNSQDKRGFCGDDSDDDEILECEGCKITHKWHNDIIVTFDDDDALFDKIDTRTILQFRGDHTLTITVESKYFLGDNAAELYNEVAESTSSCSKINPDKYFLKVTVKTQYVYDFANCDLTYCGTSGETDCTVKVNLQKKLCGFDDDDLDTSFDDDCGDLPTITYEDVEFRDSCNILDLVPETDGALFIFFRGSATSLVVSTGVLCVALLSQFFA